MATFVTDCPHCGTNNVSMVTFGQRIGLEKLASPSNDDGHRRWPYALAAVCSKCDAPVVAKAQTKSAHSNYAYAGQALNAIIGNLSDIEHHGFKVEALWPQAPAPVIPAFVPPDIERAMLQAERNYPTVGNEEAAAVMYRRALELALKDKAPAEKGTLAARIKKMVTSHVLTPAIGEWADEIRSLGNDAAHDEGDVDRKELAMIRGFADAVLRYLYTLPAEVAARRKLPASTA